MEQMIDGRPGLLDFARRFHWAHEHSPIDLERLLRRIGFEVTDVNDDRIIVVGPLSTATACKTLTGWGGRLMVRHLELVKVLELLTEAGVPVWASPMEQFEWHCRQLEQCAPFQVPVLEEFETRAEMEAHVEDCARCRPAFRALVEAVNHGSSRTGDQHLRELINLAHKDPDSALRFFESVRDAQLGQASRLGPASSDTPHQTLRRSRAVPV